MDLSALGTAVIASISQNPLLASVLVLLLITLIQVFLLSRRITRLTRGSTGASLESTIAELGAKTATLESHAHTTETALNNVHARLETAVRAVSVRRFDPFQNAGGQQSFATAFLSERGDGVILSGIHSRDAVRVYAKDVTAFASERELSAEEALTIADAKKQLH